MLFFFTHSESLITSPPIIFRRIGPTDITDNEDNDLLPSTTTPLSKAVIKHLYNLLITKFVSNYLMKFKIFQTTRNASFIYLLESS